MDPFHDKPIYDLQGWPDIEATASVVRCIKQSTVITAPVGFTTNWDCNIVNWPNFYAQTTNVTNVRQNNHITDLGSASGWGGLFAYCGPSGVPINTIAPTFSSHLNVDKTFLSGSSRLIGVGFEVHNTTSELYRQGSVIVWRSPGSSIEPSLYTVDTATGVNLFSGNLVRCPPLTADSALLLAGSRQWQASEGCYCVGTFSGIDNPPKLPDYTSFVVYATEDEDVVADYGPGINSSPLIIPSSPADNTSYAQRWYPINTYGAFFQGLSKETTLTLTWNCYIETFPSVAEKSLVVLATPSAPYDPNALELLDKCLAAMPVGVMVKENFMGTWFPALISAGASLLRTWFKTKGQKDVSDQIKIASKATRNAAVAANMASKQVSNDRRRNKFIAPQTSSSAKPLPPIPKKRSVQNRPLLPPRTPPK